jgi:hypothetical protein
MLLLAVVGVLACQDKVAPLVSFADSAAVGQARRIGYDRYGQPARVSLEAMTVTAAENQPLPPTPPDVSNMVIRTAEASVEVDSLETAVVQVRQLAAQFGGYVAGTDITSGKRELRNARLEVKIPASRFDESLSGLAPIGKLESVSVTAEDVGEQYVDVAARMDNARRLERRLIDLLATRTGKLKDVLDVEQALANVREEIERHEGRLRYLRAHTAMSTLSVYVHEPLPIVAKAGESVMGEALRQAWRNFVALLSIAVQSLGIVVPLGALGFVVWVVAKRVRRVETQRTD